MARVIPDSTVKLYKDVKIDSGNKETLIFKTAAERETYFNSKLVRTVNNCTTVKNKNVIRMEIPGSVIAQCNYLSFINPSFDNKIFYCKIVDYNYVNNECAEIVFAEDPWTTWMFDAKFDACYVDREGLTEAEHTAAQSNPYNPDLVKLRTAESLPVGHDVEKQTYEYGGFTKYFDGDVDGYKVFNLLSAYNEEVRGRHYITILTLSPVNWADLADVHIEGPDGELYSPYDLIDWIRMSLIHNTTNLAMYKLGDDDRYDPLKWSASVSLREYFHAPAGSETVANISEFSVPTEIYVFDDADYTFIAGSGSATFKPFEFIVKMCITLGIESSILSAYAVPVGFLDNMVKTTQSATLNAVPILTSKELYVKKGVTVDPKLLLYPFSYVRVETPMDVKEYRYEDFVASQGNTEWSFNTTRTKFASQTGVTHDENFNLAYPIVNTDNGVNLSFTPAGYKELGIANDKDTEGNVNESIRFTNLVNMPMAIDGWLSQCASNAMAAINGRTTDVLYDYGRAQRTLQQGQAGWLGDFIKTAFNATGYNPRVGALESLGSIPGLAFRGANLELEEDALRNRVNMSDSAAGALGGATEGNALYENFQYTKPAYAAAKYNPSNGGSDLYESQATFDFLLTHVQLNPAFIEVYNQYFKNYGYAYGFYKIPSVLNHIGNKANQIHWERVNGDDVSYVKTTHAHVTGVPRYVSSFIEGLLDGGVRFIKGD